MKTRAKGTTWPVILSGAALVCVATYGLSAQAPAPPAQAPAAGGRGAAQAPAEPGAPAADAAPGRGGGRGRGPESLAGGPQLSDPAYANYDFAKRPPQLPLPPAEEQKKFILQPGYRIENVLADPDIQEPGAISFDGNGRMVVIEIRGYMMDADATGQLDPVGRVSIHEDVNNDGVYEKHSVFVDKLVFPRFATPFGPNTLLIKESSAQEVWKYTDTNNDGVADKKEFFDTGYGRNGNVEHQESHLTIGLDNWMYSTENAFRARWTPHGVVKEPTGSGGAQWGVVQDNDGKMWFQGGASGLPAYWQLPILYGNFGGGGRGLGGGGAAPAAPDPNAVVERDPDLSIPWGAPVRIADMQGGLGSTRMPDGSLRGTTAGAGGDIVRGHRMPPDLQGEYLYGEVVGRIVRRVHPSNVEGITTIKNYYDGNEFIKSTDPFFRPVDQATAPDGTVYISDLYHGIIQEATWSGPGTYLRARINQYELDKVIHKGRVWRLVYDGVKVDRSDTLARDTTQPRMNDETAAQLVTHLGHPNGWWRDTAQQLLVLKQDKSVVPTLQNTLRTSTNLLEKFHVLWTLEGLGALDAATVRQQMASPEPRMRIQAIRASETLYKAGDKSFAADYKRLTTDPSVDVVMQSMLTMSKWKVPEGDATIRAVAATNKMKGVQMVATTALNAGAAGAAGGGGGGRGGGGAALSAEQQALVQKGSQIYTELCFSCHGSDGYGAVKEGDSTGATMAPRLAGSPRVNGHRDYIVKAVLNGLSGPVENKTYSEVMIPNNTQTDDWVAAVATYVRRSFGNSGGVVSVADVKRVRTAVGNRRTAWTVADLEASLPKLIVPDGWKLTASHNPNAVNGALALNSWSSQAPQAPGMWFQISFPQPMTVAEVQFDSAAAGGGRGGGGGAGRGVAPGAPGAPAGAAPGAAPAPAPAAAAAPAAGPQAAAGAGGRGGGRGAGGAAAAAPGGAPAPPPNLGFPRGYKVETSANGTTWVLAAEGKGEGASTVITIAKPVPAKFVKITQTATVDPATPWSIQQLKVYEAPRPATAR